ncbi:MerR family transcriptional regulator [Roseibium hamelinense]|nr:MerR family transcriptional regulator [Roseibium hamelinense]
MNNLATKMVAVPDIAGAVDYTNEQDDRVLAISEMSELFGVTLRTLRFYEEKGLLNPVRRGARRFYGHRDVSRMRVILQAKKIGLTLVEIRRVIKLVEGDSPKDLQYSELLEICENQQVLLAEQKALVEEQVAEVDNVVYSLKELVDQR